MRKFFILLFTCLLLPVMAWGEIQQLTTPLDFSKSESVDKLTEFGYSWDKNTSTLTLNGFNMLFEAGPDNNQIAIKLPPEATLKLIGKNTVTLNGEFAEDGYSFIRQSRSTSDWKIIGENKGSLLLQGNATNGANLIDVSNLNITDAIITVKAGLGYQNALQGRKSMNISGSTITIENSGGSGLYSNTNPSTISNSTITILKSGKAAINMNRADLTIKGSTIEIGETNSKNHAISANNITISDKSTVSVDKAGQTAVYASKNISIGNSNITVDKAGYGGFTTGAGTITIENSYVDIDGSSSKFKCINVNNGTDNKPAITNSLVWEKESGADAKKTGTVYGEYTLEEDLTINSGEVFVTNENARLTIQKTLTNKGEMRIGENSTFAGSGTLVDNEGTFIVEAPTESMITVPQNLVYTGEDLTNTARNKISLSQKILGQPIDVDVDKDWVSTIAPKTVKDAGEYTVKYVKGEETISKTFKVGKASTLSSGNFNVKMPENASYDGKAKEAEVTSSLDNIGKITVQYKDSKGNLSTDAPIEPGTYSVVINIAEGNNNLQINNLEDASWTFTIKPSYTVTLSQTTGGTIYASQEKHIVAGSVVTLRYTEKGNYYFTGWSVICNADNSKVTVNENTFFMPEGNVTVSALFNYNPPYTPPTPTYYTVTLPHVEGATTDPQAGDYEVESWDHFDFYLTLDEDYNQSVPVVTTSRGEEIKPRASDGKYIIRYVLNDLEIFIDGVVKNSASVGNEEIVKPVRLWIQEGTLHLTVLQPETVRIYTFDGVLKLQKKIPAGETTINLSPNTYIISIGERNQKVIIR